MKTALLWTTRIALGLVLLAGLAIVAIYALSSAKLAATFDAPAEALSLDVDHDDPALRLEGQRLATITGCTGCHGETLAGQVFVDIPNVVRLVAPNLTTFTAGATDEALVRVIRFGIKPDGTSVLGMPSNSFHSMADDDLAAILAFLRSQPVRPDGTDQTNAYRIMARLGLALGEFELPAAEIADRITAGAERDPATDRGEPMPRGEYLAQLACAECHGGDLNGRAQMQSPSLAIVRGYGRDDFETLMKTGLALGGRELGLMTRVARGRFAAFTEEEIEALYVYLHAFGGQRADAAAGSGHASTGTAGAEGNPEA